MINNTSKLILFHLFAHTMLVPAILYGELWMWITSFIWWQFIASTAISPGYHRYFSHKAFRTKKWYEWYSQFLALFANPGPVLTWASAHRMHHAYSDTTKDPHSPSHKGYFKVYTGLWGHDVKIERKFLKGLSSHSTKFFHKHYFTMLSMLTVGLFIVDPLLFVFGWAIPVVFAFHGYGIINTITHRNGKVHNSRIANILTGGEGDHLYHHKHSNAKMITKYWDPSYYFIRLIENKK